MSRSDAYTNRSTPVRYLSTRRSKSSNSVAGLSMRDTANPGVVADPMPSYRPALDAKVNSGLRRICNGHLSHHTQQRQPLANRQHRDLDARVVVNAAVELLDRLRVL